MPACLTSPVAAGDAAACSTAGAGWACEQLLARAMARQRVKRGIDIDGHPCGGGAHWSDVRQRSSAIRRAMAVAVQAGDPWTQSAALHPGQRHLAHPGACGPHTVVHAGRIPARGGRQDDGGIAPCASRPHRGAADITGPSRHVGRLPSRVLRCPNVRSVRLAERSIGIDVPIRRMSARWRHHLQHRAPGRLDSEGWAIHAVAGLRSRRASR